MKHSDVTSKLCSFTITFGVLGFVHPVTLYYFLKARKTSSPKKLMSDALDLPSVCRGPTSSWIRLRLLQAGGTESPGQDSVSDLVLSGVERDLQSGEYSPGFKEYVPYSVIWADICPT